ncbi:MAG: OmpA family protein [Candidatus Aminicenantes bacterium]|nr:OmpA family protein [Candidatus Aminicenantes bacterium]
MNPAIKTIFLLLILLGLFTIPAVSSTAPGQDEENILIPPDAHENAVAALARLGPERGALPLSYKVLTIEGVYFGVSARMEKIKKALDDLGAKESDTDYVIELEGDVLFDLDEWTIREDGGDTLLKVGEIIKSYNHPVSLTGHTDSLGSDEYNLSLSEKRARSVKGWLVTHSGIEASLIETDGKGEKEPIAPNTHSDGSDNPEGRQKNRRVEIRIKK